MEQPLASTHVAGSIVHPRTRVPTHRSMIQKYERVNPAEVAVPQRCIRYSSLNIAFVAFFTS